jgi:3-deoxy-D-manno-octulosonic-acid transferase
LGSENIKNYGNLKFSKIKTDLNYKLDSDFLNKIKNRKIWCCASTHPTEEILCAKSHLKIKKKHENIFTIIIPRHIDRVKKIYAELSKLNLKIVLSSSLDQMNAKTDILLVDSYGESLKFYNISKYVFLGKSLVTSLIKDSGQNPIEPARLSCKIFHGPYVSNFVEIYKYFNELGIAKEINGSDELSISLVEEFEENKPKDPKIAEKIENYGQNILNNVTMEIKKYI